VDGHRWKRDLLFDGFPFDDLERLSNTLRSRRRIKESRREFTFANPGDAFIRQCIDAEELDLLLAARVFRGKIRTIGDRIIVTIHKVNLVELLARSRHRVVTLRLLPIAVDRLQQRLDAGFLFGKRRESIMTVVSRLSAHPAPELNDGSLGVPWAAEQLYSVFTR